MQQLLDAANDAQELAAASVIEIDRASGEIATTTVELSSNVLRRLTPAGPAVPFGPGAYRYLTRSSDTLFDLAEGLLAVQRDVTSRLLDAVRPLLLGEPVPEPAEKSTARSDEGEKAA